MTRGSATCDQNFAYFTPLGANVVHCYSLTRDTWSQLPQCPYRNCGLAIVNGALVAVGGRKAYSDYSNKLLTLRVRHWFEELPPMALSRDSPSLVALEHGSGSTDILVAGGSVSDSKWTASVEIFDARNQRWISLVDLPTPLPFPSAALRHTATSGTLLLSVIGCYRDGYTCSLYLSTESVRTSGWLSLPKLPASGSTTGVLTDELVIVGGWKSSSSVSCVYQLIEDTWVTVGTVSNGTECLTASTPANQLVIVGGDGGCQNVCICSVY